MRRVIQSAAAALPLLAALLSYSHTARATSVQQFDLNRLFAESGLVVRAHVLDGSSYARDMASDGVCTEITLEVQEVIAGQWNPNELLVFCLPGGITPEGKMQMVLGAPMPRVGDTYVLFIKSGPWSYTPFVNWFYGALREEQLQGQTVLVTGLGDCVLSASDAYVELGANLSSEDQIRNLRSLGVSVESVMSPQSSQGTLSSSSGAGQNREPVKRSNQCALSSAVVDNLRQRARARAETSSLSSSSQPPAPEAFHTPLQVLMQRGAR